MAVIQHFGLKTEGRRFVMGDLHGCLKTFHALLEKIRFDESKDEIHSVGDLTDRGPHSLETLLLTRHPWFHAIRGNHEEFIVQYLAGHERAVGRNHIGNGGEWFYDLDDATRELAGELVRALPYGAAIETDFGTIALSHAGTLDDWKEHCDSWEQFAELSKTKREKLHHRTLWSRSRIKDRRETPVTNVTTVMVGHSPVPAVGALGNTLYIDTGCGAGRWPQEWIAQGYQPRLTAVELANPLVFHEQERLDTVMIYR